MNTTPSCDFCGSVLPADDFYEPINSRRGMRVYACTQCGLMQSVSTAEYQSHPPPSMSCDADRASIKYTKDLCLAPHLKLLEGSVPFKTLKRFLDVGSNRGAFLRAMRALNPALEITAVESDPALTPLYADLPGVTAFPRRLEETPLPSAHFDFAYCAHTLEHFFSARAMFRKIQTALRTGGLSFYAVPNLLLLAPDSFEELFIDTHTYHFHYGVLERLFAAHQAEIVIGCAPDAPELDYLLKKRTTDIDFDPRAMISPENVELSVSYLKRYRQTISANRAKLRAAAARIGELCAGKPLVFWGAGRLFDGLMKLGGLERGSICMLIDRYLSPYMPEVHGIPIRPPEALRDVSPDALIVIAARDYEIEIAEEARALGFANLVAYSALMK